MSRYEEIRFRGIVKKEYRDSFTSIALEGKWTESEVKELRDFGKVNHNAYRIPLSDYEGKYAVKRWNSESWEKTYNKETGEWQFRIGVNEHDNPSMLLEWEDKIIPFLMESVDHYEVWLEPVGDELYIQSTVLLRLVDGELKVVGYFEEDGTYVSSE